MHNALRTFCWLPRMAGIAVILAFPAVSAFGQAPAAPSTPAMAAPTGESAPAPCPHVADADHPINQVLQVKVTGTLDSGHLKPGKQVWFSVVKGMAYPGCTLEQDVVVYAHVTSASSSKNPNASELSLVFDRADCTGHAKQELKMRLIGLVGPPDERGHMHDAMPTEVGGRGRNIDDTMAGTNGLDLELNPGGPPHTVRPGIVVGIPKVKLEPQGGPGCSARMTSTERSIQLGTGSELLLVVPAAK
jgi:hypothetical protein